jgi:hypothetical protein
MRNLTLQRGPCNFLDLRISPWEIPFLLLLCFSPLSVLLLSGVYHSGPHPYPHPGRFSLSLSLSSPRGSGAEAERALVRAHAAQGGPERVVARQALGPSGSGGRARRPQQTLAQRGSAGAGAGAWLLAAQAHERRRHTGDAGSGARGRLWLGPQELERAGGVVVEGFCARCGNAVASTLTSRPTPW